MSEDEAGSSLFGCDERRPGTTCEVCGAVMGPLTDLLPSTCVNLEARSDRVRDVHPRYQAPMERVGGSVADKIAGRRAKQD